MAELPDDWEPDMHVPKPTPARLLTHKEARQYDTALVVVEALRNYMDSRTETVWADVKEALAVHDAVAKTDEERADD